MKRILLNLVLVAALPISVLGCSGDSNDDSAANAEPSVAATAEASDPLGKDELLNSLDDVRAMIVDADINPAGIEDVAYDAGTLRVTLSGVDDASNAVAMKDRCDDISSAVALPDLQIILQTPDGIIMAECTFTG